MKPEDNFRKYNEVKKMWDMREEYERELKRGVLSDPAFTSKVVISDPHGFMYGWVRSGKDLCVLNRVKFQGAKIHAYHYRDSENAELTLNEILMLEKCGLKFYEDEYYKDTVKMSTLLEIGT